ncbi:hypothetical protein Y024_5477 [Burkholderia pseudomallei TSV44]|nr:hypothetical protein Y024_5477 [Burkholderia pseudomallei TSV44]
MPRNRRRRGKGRCGGGGAGAACRIRAGAARRAALVAIAQPERLIRARERADGRAPDAACDGQDAPQQLLEIGDAHFHVVQHAAPLVTARRCRDLASMVQLNVFLDELDLQLLDVALPCDVERAFRGMAVAADLHAAFPRADRNERHRLNVIGKDRDAEHRRGLRRFGNRAEHGQLERAREGGVAIGHRALPRFLVRAVCRAAFQCVAVARLDGRQPRRGRFAQRQQIGAARQLEQADHRLVRRREVVHLEEVFPENLRVRFDGEVVPALAGERRHLPDPVWLEHPRMLPDIGDPAPAGREAHEYQPLPDIDVDRRERAVRAQPCRVVGATVDVDEAARMDRAVARSADVCALARHVERQRALAAAKFRDVADEVPRGQHERVPFERVQLRVAVDPGGHGLAQRAAREPGAEVDGIDGIDRRLAMSFRERRVAHRQVRIGQQVLTQFGAKRRQDRRIARVPDVGREKADAQQHAKAVRHEWALDVGEREIHALVQRRHAAADARDRLAHEDAAVLDASRHARQGKILLAEVRAELAASRARRVHAAPVDVEGPAVIRTSNVPMRIERAGGLKELRLPMRADVQEHADLVLARADRRHAFLKRVARDVVADVRYLVQSAKEMPVVGSGGVFDRAQHRRRAERARVVERQRLAGSCRVARGGMVEMRGHPAHAVEQGLGPRVPVGQRRRGCLARADHPFVLFTTTCNQLSFVFLICVGVVHLRVPSHKNATTKLDPDNGSVVVFIIGNGT